MLNFRLFCTRTLLLILLLPSFRTASQSFRTDKELLRGLNEIVRNFNGTAGVYVRHLKSGRGAAINADTVFPTASIIKVPILAGIFHKIEQGELAYHQPLLYRDSLAYGGSGLMTYFKDSTETDLSMAVSLMISYSDNAAALWCQSLAGGGEAINRWLEEQGYMHTRVNSRTPGRETDREKYGWGQTTPREMAELFVQIRKGEVISRAACERMYRLLSHIYYDEYALSQISPFVQTASKQGMVNASRSEGVLVNAPHGDYVFYVATKNNKDTRWKHDNEAWELARSISAFLWDYFEPRNNW